MRQTLQITKEEKNAMISDLIEKIKQFYCIQEKIPDIVRNLENDLKDGKYSKFSSYSDLAHQLTMDLQKYAEDYHFWVGVKQSQKPETENAANEFLSEKQIYEYTNGNIVEIDRLPGNIGYIKLYEFPSIQYAAPSILNALEFLKHTDAIIFDVRFNGGGDSRLVQYIISYFLDNEPVHIYDFHNPEKGTKDQTWTLPYVGAQHHPEKPLYILTSHRSASAAEDLSYSLQSLKRALIIGEKTRGAANAPELFFIQDLLEVEIPVYRPINVHTKSNWEKSGVIPDIKVSQEDALKTAHLHAIISLSNLDRPLSIQKMFEFETDFVQASYNSVPVDKEGISSFVGAYQSIEIKLHGNKLLYCHKNVHYHLVTSDNTVYHISERLRIRFGEEGSDKILICEFREPRSSVKYRKGIN